MARMRWLLNDLGAEVVHPGEVLQRVYMAPFELSQNELARRLGVPPRCVNQIVNGQRAITARTALRLASLFGGDGMDWLERQALWDLHQARRAAGRRGPRRRPNAAELERRERLDREAAAEAAKREFLEKLERQMVEIRRSWPSSRAGDSAGSPPVGDDSPLADDDAPPSDDDAPPSDDDAPAPDHDAPAPDDDAP